MTDATTTTTEFGQALLGPDALTVTWTGVDPSPHETLLLSLILKKPGGDGAWLQLGTKWVDGELAAVFAFDFAVSKQRNADEPGAAVTLRDGQAVLTYPREWLGTFLDEPEAHSTATLNVNGQDVREWHGDVDLADD